MRFFKARYAQHLASTPGRNFEELQPLISKEWAKMNPAQRAPYNQAYLADLVRFCLLSTHL